MNIVKPAHKIIGPVLPGEVIAHLEACGRVAYKSEDKIAPGSAECFIGSIIGRGHESVIEHYNVSVWFRCDRGVTHELVRHRLVSYTQESTRYCNYSKLGVTFVCPPWGLTDEDVAFLELSERMYNQKIAQGMSPQQARYFLPNGLKTEIVATANLREWRHILRLRTAKEAHPQMRELMIPLLREFQLMMPVVFGDIELN